MRRLLLLLLLVATACGGRRSGCGAAASADDNAAGTPSDTPRPIEQRAVLLFTGDVMQHTPQLTAARRGDSYDYSESFACVAPLLRAADLAVVNLETTLADAPPYTGYPLFRSPAALADALAACGVDVACLANNHALDGGAAGVRSTAAHLARTGIRHTGIFADSAAYRRDRILRFDLNGIRLALLNYTYGTNGLPTPQGMVVHRIDTTALKRDLAAASEADCRVVCIHWGNEYERQPNAAQRRLAALLRRAGADLVIGHHPHVIQRYEGDSTGGVCYSLGNFVSNQRRRYRDGGLMARITLTKRTDGKMHYATELLPVWVDRRGYRILPREVADTLPLGEEYRLFRQDTDSLLSAR